MYPNAVVTLDWLTDIFPVPSTVILLPIITPPNAVVVAGVNTNSSGVPVISDQGILSPGCNALSTKDLYESDNANVVPVNFKVTLSAEYETIKSATGITISELSVNTKTIACSSAS